MSQPVTLITGAAGALGSAVFAELLACGHKVAAVDLDRSAARLEELAAGAGDRAIAVTMAADDPGGLSTHLDAVARRLGEPTGAVLIAGGWRGGKKFHEEDDDETWSAMFRLNLGTAESALRALLPGMVARKRGSVVVIGSRAAERPWTSARASAYGASKAALVTLIQTVAAEVIDDGVRLNAVLPSVIDTPANRASMPKADHTAWVPPASLAKVIAFLLSDDAAAISGAAVPAYGRA